MSIHFNIIVHACTCMMFISNHIYRKVHVPKFEYIEDIQCFGIWNLFQRVTGFIISCLQSKRK